jgi:hypothetical protein
MGRPLRKDINGVDAIGIPTGAATGITCEFYRGSLRTDGIIIKQRGSDSYTVTRVGEAATTSTYRICTLQSTQPNAENEMRIQGSTSGTLDTDLVAIAKLTKRVATDFSGNKYTWFLENDSSADYIVLTPITS